MRYAQLVPLHAKVLAALLSLSLLLGISEFVLGGAESGSIFAVVIRALVLVGFLKGNEGIRTLLLIGAGLNVLLGGFGVVAALAVLAADAGLGMVLIASSGFTVAVGLYMLYALKNAEVQHWMLNRALDGALDE